MTFHRPWDIQLEFLAIYNDYKQSTNDQWPMRVLETDYKQSNKLCTCVSLLELEFESMIMSTKIWSSARSTCSVHNVKPFSNGRVLVVSATMASPSCHKCLPILKFLSCLLVLSRKEVFFLFLDVVRWHGVLTLCVTLDIVVNYQHLP